MTGASDRDRVRKCAGGPRPWRRLGKLEQLLRNLRKLTELDRDAFLTDEAVQAQAERWTHLAVECAIDLANHLIARSALRMDTA